ncbi:MAG: ComEC/Rec2 family competence protein [Candidatus Brennerbacteria bacterium]
MRVYDSFFFGAMFFLVGIFAASLSAGAGVEWGRWLWWMVVVGVVGTFIAWWWQGKGWKFKRWERNGWLVMAALLLFIPAGALYCAVDDVRFNRTPLPVGEGTFRAEVVSHPISKDGTREAVVTIGTDDLRVLVKLPPYPALSYGDRITLSGRMEEPFSDSYRAYLAKERVRGVIAFPKLIAREPGDFSLRGTLYAFRDEIVDSFRRTLPAKEAALMAGLTVGAREDFSESFRDAMTKSGTTHLVALSGYNISIVVIVAMAFFLTFLPRRFAFFATLAVVCSFVLMTGAEASVVRAAVMGGIALLAQHMGRRFSVRNAIVFAALVMVLINPKVLVFDLGFQLSFLALLGIVYLKPSLDKFFGWSGKPGIFSWRENLTTTASAQLVVAPLLISTFGSVSLSSLAANVIILEVVPLTMGLGFVLAAVSFLPLVLSKVFALFTLLFLKFQTFTIELFAALALPVGPALSIGTIVLYYCVLLVFIWYANTRFISRKI